MSLNKNILFCLFIVLSASNLFAQNNFNVAEYKKYLENHKNLSSESLLKLYPAGVFNSGINQNINSALYLDSIIAKYNLTGYEKSLLQKYGFMVSERLSKSSIGGSLLEIFQNDLPVFISTDAILHALHISYDRILKDVEVGALTKKLEDLLTNLHVKVPELAAKYNLPEMNVMLHDVDIYLTVPLRLLGKTEAPYYADNESKIAEILSKIKSEQGMDYYSLFSDSQVIYDWSQFKPRGHYVDSLFPKLADYFRAMMWLGRIEIYLLPPRAVIKQSFEDIRRQTIDALLITELFEISNSTPQYNEIENTLKFFVGDQDNVKLPDIQYLKNSVSITRADELLDSTKLITFQDSLKQQSFAYQLILSQILIHDPMSPDSIIPASSFLLFGQRFVIDSYVTSQVVFDKTKECRLFPSMLDPMFALGNNAAAQLLHEELDKYKYAENLAALRYLIDAYGTDFWQMSMYNMWLNSVRSLNPPEDKKTLPAFMQTGAYWQEKLNTQLASWTQLRHDNLLYAKQSYTGSTVCSFPYTYIEPFPEFYRTLKIYSEKAENELLKVLSSLTYDGWQIKSYFNNFYHTADTLEIISQKELDKVPFTAEEINFLKRVIYNQTQGSGTMPYDGWYAKLYYHDDSKGLLTSDNLVADVHTTPTDCMGVRLGAVTHAGTGPINLGVFITDLPGGALTAFIGPVLSFYEYTTTNFQRLTDQEWSDKYLASSLRPSWVNTYLADVNGDSKGEGLNLITGTDDKALDEKIPENYLIVSNVYPNPAQFNPVITVSFTVSAKLTNSMVELSIYNIQGKLIKKIINQPLPSGKYVARWDAKNESGFNVASGIYFLTLRVADQSVSKKIIYLK